jgi:hypothetical protein
MKEEEYTQYILLKKKLEKSCLDLLKWAEKHPELEVPKYDKIFFDVIEDGYIFYEGYLKTGNPYYIDIYYTLPVNLLFSEEKKDEYINKRKEKIENKKKEIENKKKENEKKRYEKYLELKKEFE